MKYRRFGSPQPPKNVPIWGCAYEATYSKEGMSLKKEPVLGMIVDEGWRTFFYELKKNGDIKKSSKVYSHSRIYADTLDECIELYNDTIDSHVRHLKILIEESELDKIVKI